MKILIVDDEVRLVEGLRKYFEQAGFQVLAAHDGPAGLNKALNDAPDLVVLDLMLPGMDGLDVCREIRRRSNVPIIMLTARVEEADKLVGLELGADDYMTKPFSPRELVARARTVLRRVQPQSAPDGLASAQVYRYKDFTLDTGTHQLAGSASRRAPWPAFAVRRRTVCPHIARGAQRGGGRARTSGHGHAAHRLSGGCR